MVANRSCNLFYDKNAANYIVEYRGNFKEQIDKITYSCGHILNDRIAIVAVNPNNLTKLKIDVPSIILIDFRTIFVLQDTDPASIDNISNVKINPYLNLTGRDVVIGVVDSGIDYLNDEFISEDGTSRIISIWDQSIENSTESVEYIGKIYTNEEINNAITAKKNNKDPYEIVPSKDVIGHGTKVCGIIGARGFNSQFQGIAPNCKFVIVKLFESSNFKKMLADNGITNVPAYNPSEILSGIEYLSRMFVILNKPMVIFLGAGSSEGGHDGTNLLSRYVTSLGGLRGLCFVTGTGNEGASQGHVTRYIENVGEASTVQLRIPREMKYFSLYIWVQRPNKASITIISPTGESSKIIRAKLNNVQNLKFIFVNTSLVVTYYTPDHYTGHEVINLAFTDIKPGIWTFQLIGDYITNGRFDIWLPPKNTLPENTEFFEPDSFSTLTIPSAAINVITTAYLGENNSLIAQSGKGFNTNDLINPDIATLGINVITTKPSGGITTLSGSSAAAAISAGVCALLLQWGIIYGNDTTMYTKKIRSYLLYGAKRNKNTTYPSRDVGYGELDILGTFNVISRLFRDNFESKNTFPNYLNSESNRKYIEYYINKLFIRAPT